MKNAFNEEKFREEFAKFSTVRDIAQRYLVDTDRVISMVKDLKEKKVLNLDDDYMNDSDIWNEELECFTTSFAMLVWREVILPAFGYSYDEYQVFNDILKSLKKVGKSI